MPQSTPARYIIDGTHTFDLGVGDFTATEYEVTSVNSIRYFGTWKPIEGFPVPTILFVILNEDLKDEAIVNHEAGWKDWSLEEI